VGYHYRVEVPTGYAEEVRDVIEPPDAVANMVDGSKLHHTNDVSLLNVFSSQLESLTKLKAWSDAHPEVPELTVITMVGTPLPVPETELESLRSAVQSHQTLEVEAPARGNMGPD
jgi:hypothetical protein